MLFKINPFPFSDHAFDAAVCKNRDSKIRKAEVSLPSEPAKGEQGVRQFFRRKENNISDHVRAELSTDVLRQWDESYVLHPREPRVVAAVTESEKT